MAKKDKDKNKDCVIYEDGVEVYSGKWKNREDKSEKLSDHIRAKALKKLLKGFQA